METRYNLRTNTTRCAECGRLSVIEPPAVYLLDSGLLIEGDAETVRQIHQAIRDIALGTGMTTWQTAAILLQEALKAHG